MPASAPAALRRGPWSRSSSRSWTRSSRWKSVLDQTHANLELIVVDGGAASAAVAIGDLQRSDPRLRRVSLPVDGLDATRNLGLKSAAGDYIAFLSPRDRFAPNKIEVQLAVMQEKGSLFSHTSYDVIFPERHSGVGRVSSGRFHGVVYPKIIADCPIATSTVMLHRSLVDAGFRFATEGCPAEDVMLWISVARDHEALGIDDPLSVVEWSTKNVMIDLAESIRATARLLDQITNDPVHSRHTGEIAALRHIHQQLVERAAHQDPAAGGRPLNEALISSAFWQ
jgi:glycosyltransferase involved in cell wall biosynthesis